VAPPTSAAPFLWLLAAGSWERSFSQKPTAKSITPYSVTPTAESRKLAQMRTAEVLSETSRVEAFSDGVFAIAITLLILEIRVPERAQAGALGAALLHLWPSFLAFATSFFEIGVMWINHHRLFTVISTTDQRVLIWKMLLLFGIAFLPFPTALMARHLTGPGGWEAAALYNATLFFIALAYHFLWRYASRDRHLIPSDVDQRSLDGITNQYRFGPAIYFAALIALSWNGVLTLVVHLALAIYFILPPSRFRK